MRSREFVTEVPMNPGVYAQSIETGSDQGVLVGYEFEVCVPEDTINQPLEIDGIPDWVKRMPKKWFKIAHINDDGIDHGIKLRQPIEFNGQQYTSISKLNSAYVEKKIEEPIKSWFESLPDDIRAGINQVWRKDQQQLDKEYGGDNWKDNIYLHFAGTARNYIFREISRSKDNGKRNTPKELAKMVGPIMKIRDEALNGDLANKDFLQDIFGTTKFIELYQHPALELFQDYWSESDDFDDYSGDAEYQGAVKVLTPALKRAYGKVVVFDTYHQMKKDATSWYIEPDGSLKPDGPMDGAAEVVSPPLPVKQSIEALKTFYSIARQLKLYTNQSTGLHINVSIPAKLDVMKLAVFLGDEHVLSSWDRLDSEYAQSVMQNIQTDPDFTLKRYNPTTEKGFKALQRIVKDVTDDHVASISYNGKYVSFRHTGGDYLSDYSSVTNVVGRFVRAMVIAADPSAYRKEYMAKLIKLLTRGDKPAAVGIGSITALKTQPVKAVATVMYGVNRQATPKKLVKNYIIYEEGTIIASPALTQQIANQNYQSVYSKVKDTTKKQMDKFAKNGAVAVVLEFPDTAKMSSADPEPRAMYNDGRDDRLCIYITVDVTLQPGTPDHTEYLNTLIAQYKKQVKDKMTTNRAQQRSGGGRR